MMAGESGTGPRIVFAAVVAFCGKRTADGRTIVAPEGFRCPVRALPVPVFGWEEPRNAVQVGQINEAYVIDNRITVFGHMSTGPVARTCAGRLSAGTHFLEIDMDHIQYETMNQSVTETGEVSADLQLVSWRLTSAFVGDRPCWDLPPVQIEELTR